MRLALKIEITTRRAAADGVPALLAILRRQHARATFVAGARHLGGLKAAAEAGFDIGLLATETRPWPIRLCSDKPGAHAARLTAAVEEYRATFGAAPGLHAATDWRCGPHGLRLTQRLGFACASDARGRHPFLPVWNGEIVRCPQIPTTLPMIGEISRPGTPPETIRDALLEITVPPAPAGHVFAFDAGDMTRQRQDLFESLLTGWREQGHELASVQSLADACDMDKLPRHEVVVGTVPGSRVPVLLQGEEFLSAWRHPA
jgi:hypothetical protein